MGLRYMEGRLLQASLQSVMMLPVLLCSQEEQLHLLQQHTSNKEQTIKQRYVQGICWTLHSVIMSNPKQLYASNALLLLFGVKYCLLCQFLEFFGEKIFPPYL